jgi:uncharacterized protein (DUF1330 family)
MTVTLCVLLTPVPGQEQTLVEYEDRVLERLAAHGARLLRRVRALDPTESPYEVQIIDFPSEDALEAFMQDPARVALAGQREQAIAVTQVLRVEAV